MEINNTETGLIRDGSLAELDHEESWYMERPMNGAEALRVCQIALARWYKEHGGDEMLWHWRMIGGDPALDEDWALSIAEMLEEKRVQKRLPSMFSRKYLEACKCCEKCKYKE